MCFHERSWCRADRKRAQSSFATVKTEFYYRRVWQTKMCARTEVGAWIAHLYNWRRRHASLGQITRRSARSRAVAFELQLSRKIADSNKAANPCPRNGGRARA